MDVFSDRVAVITGGASGIGLAIAKVLARERMKLVLADMNGAALDHVIRNLTADGAEAIGVDVDVSDIASVERLADATWQRFGAAHLLVNNAGVAVYGAAAELTHADWQWSLNVNLWGAIHGVEVFLPRMLAQGVPGHLVNTSSFAGIVTSRNMAAYNVAKAGVVALSESLHKDLRGTRIGVSVLCPMRVATNVWETSANNRPVTLGGPEAFRERPKTETQAMSGAILDTASVAELVLEAIRRNELYILPHVEGRPMVRRRFEKMDAAFDNAKGTS